MAFSVIGRGLWSARSADLSENRSILYHLDGGQNFRWNAESNFGTSVLVTYSFSESGELPSTNSAFDNPYDATSFSDFTSAQRHNFRIAAAEFMAVSGIVLVEVDGYADINVFNAHGTYVGGYADLPYVDGNYQSEVNLVVDSSGNYESGSYGYFTILHELGHAVGLDHTHEGAYSLNSSMDSTANTVMSYNYDASAVGLQSLDEDALQQIYGTRAVSAGWSVSHNEAKYRIDAIGSNGADSLAVPMTVKGAALATKIFGHNGNDVITGQSAYGGSGDDYINGGSGQDTIYAGAGDDTITGASGSDEAYGDNGADILFGKLNDDILDGGSGVDVFVFKANSDHDTITDFDSSSEVLRFMGTGFDFSDVSVSTVDGHAQVQVGSVVIDLLGVSAASIGADDFQFV